MDVSLPQKDLEYICHVAAKAADDPKTHRPALAQIHLEARDGQLWAEGTDTYVTASLSVPADIAVGGDVLVPKFFADYAAAMPAGTVRLQVREGPRVYLSSAVEKRRFDVIGMPGSDWPLEVKALVKEGEAQHELTLPIPTLLYLLQTAIPTVGKDETKPAVNSVLLRWGGGTIEAVSTDGNRLTRLLREHDGGSSGSLMVGLRAAKLAQALLTKELQAEQKECRLRIGPNEFAILVGDMTFFGKIPVGQYPAYMSVMPQQWLTRVRVTREKFLAVLDAVAVQGSKDVLMVVKADGTIVLSNATAAEGEAEDQLAAIEILGMTGLEMKNTYAPLLLREALAHLDVPEVIFSLADGSFQPCSITRPEDLGGSPLEARHIAVVMPKRT